jgi:hypothetical protein
MKKPKKITIKFFLNENLKEVETSDKTVGYPLYNQVTYDRKNTQIKCRYGKGYYPNMLEVQQNYGKLLLFEESILKRMVEFEIKRLGVDFHLKGLGKVYDNYSLSIFKLFNSYLKVRLKTILQKAMPDEFLEILQMNENTDFDVLFRASEKLFDNFKELLMVDFLEEMKLFEIYKEICHKILDENEYKFPVIMDWLDGSHPAFLDKKLKEKYPQNRDYQKKMKDLIEKIITTKLELK